MGSEQDTKIFGWIRKPTPIQKQETTISMASLGPAINDEEYFMKHPRRGLAIIFNHYTFKDSHQAPRAGASVDQQEMHSTLTKLGFDIDICTNFTKLEILRKLKEVAVSDHSNSDCLVVVVMTHGDSKEICAYDQSYDVGKLWEPFKGENAPTLIAKPKLFFIQACRGMQVDSGVRVQARLATQVDSVPSRSFYAIPSISDIIIVNATFDGHYAWRSGESGSWFIQELAKELKMNGETKEICEILTTVNRRVAISHESYVPTMPGLHLKKQMPNFLSTLTRKLYFRPKS